MKPRDFYFLLLLAFCTSLAFIPLLLDDQVDKAHKWLMGTTTALLLFFLLNHNKD